jgi:four helix bundle protein
MTNDQAPMTKQPSQDHGPWENERLKYGEHESLHFVMKERPDGRPQLPVDLEERTAKFGEAIIQFCEQIPRGPGSDRIIDQLVGCGTSIGGNYCEADEAVSKKEFTTKICTCKKEAKETKFFLRMAATAEPELRDEARVLWQEAKELHLIFCSIFRKCRSDSKGLR